MYEARPALHDSGSRPHQRINIFGAAKSVGDNLLLMLASDRLGRSSQRDFSTIDDRERDDPHVDEFDSQCLTNEPLAMALAEWR